MSNKKEKLQQKKKGIIKIILIGDTNVGKTCILSKYINNNISIINCKPTIGVDFLIKQINIDNQLITAQIWDTSGQERFKSLSNVFYRGADACIFVYDITNKSSFNNISYWKQQFLTEHNNNCPMLLLGNKNDLELERQARMCKCM